MKIHLFYLIFILILPISATSQYFVEYNEAIDRAYQQTIRLEFDHAEAILDSLRLVQNENLAILHIENYIDFFQLFIHESKDYFDKNKRNKNRRLKQIDKLNNNDPYKKFLQAEINLQWALLRAKFGELFNSGRELYAAYNLLEDNVDRHPEFVYNYKSLSVIHALIETISIPGIFKDIFGIKGTIELGVEEISKLIKYQNENKFIFEYEAETIYAFIQFYQCNNEKLALDFLSSSKLAQEDIALAKFVHIKILQRSGKNDQAIKLLSETIENIPPEKFPYLYFMMGISKLRKLDPEAKDYFHSFLHNFDGQHYIKEAYQKLAWCELVFDDNIPMYKYNLYQCSTKGNELIDDDKQAQKEAINNDIPHPILLKARLLFDGGYAYKAFNLMIKNAHLFYNDEKYSIEYFYRLARISQDLKNYADAINYFNQAIDSDVQRSSYMSCNAALQLGLIYESQGQFALSESNFRKCLSMSPTEYKNSLHQKAKSGLNRIKK